ncbi:hypothetical protein ZHAS_00019410 [Anopheles sinensis]|uniref:Uncharacterized protein n=1 Tax=Anopheles sinensis TaxID=74873 RepID=A0A084WMA6_ANOSI|nr:hypothetical protein ZHAS_00019410 [Anopheles sinensis]
MYMYRKLIYHVVVGNKKKKEFYIAIVSAYTRHSGLPHLVVCLLTTRSAPSTQAQVRSRIQHIQHRTSSLRN